QTCRGSSKTAAYSLPLPVFRKFRSTTASLQVFRFRLRTNCKPADRSTTPASAIGRARLLTVMMPDCLFTSASHHCSKSRPAAGDLVVVAAVAHKEAPVAHKEAQTVLLVVEASTIRMSFKRCHSHVQLRRIEVVSKRLMSSVRVHSSRRRN